jgi:lipopolysaccharide/colanic/teichoic acid biosynthesis glycosyltransferase
MKRLFDIAVAGTLLVLLAPLILTVALLVRVGFGSPVVFRQVRPGLKGKAFTLLKFRSMRDATDACGNPLPDEQRLTGFGRMLRASSLDELPSLWNVLKGEMSMVGPRPMLMEYLPLYNERQFRRHDVLPGVTGWAQINGRNNIAWERKFELDVWYVENRSFYLDMKIIALTAWKIVSRDGVAKEGHATTDKFMGNRNA